MKPSLYTLQVSHDGITFTDAKNWKTNAVITAINLDTIWNYIHRYRELGIQHYYRIKGTAGASNPIYSNIISKFSDDYVKTMTVINTGDDYAVGIAGARAFIAADKVRHLKKNTGGNAQYARFSGQKVGNKIYFNDIVNSNIYVYDIPTETITNTLNAVSIGNYWISYHQSSNSLYYVDVNLNLRKFDLSTNTSTLVGAKFGGNQTNAYFTFTMVGDVIYGHPNRYRNAFYSYNIVTDTLVTRTFTTYDTGTTSPQYVKPIYFEAGNYFIIPPMYCGKYAKYDVATQTLTEIGNSLSTGTYLYYGTISADGTKVLSPFGDGTGIEVYNTVDNSISKITTPIPSGNNGIQVLENGKYAVTNVLNTKGLIYDNGETLAIDVVNKNFNNV